MIVATAEPDTSNVRQTSSGLTATASAQGFDRLDLAAIAYLALPVLIFLLGWLNWWVGLPLGILMLAGFRSLAGLKGHPVFPPKVRWGVAALVLIVSAGWAALGGAGHLFYANWDWIMRDAVLRDLVVGGWPVGYGEVDGSPLILRAPLGFYLPAALIGKIFGLQWSDPALLVWTVTGVALFLGLAVTRFSTWRSVLVVITVLVLFSGMDIVGTVLRGGFDLAARLRPTDHLEWWAERFQFSSHTTQLFWVPNHALAGWIATALLIRHQANPRFLGILPLLMVLIPTWSPLTAIGFLPLAAWWGLRHLVTEKSFRLIDPVALIAACGIAVATGAYLILGVGDIPAGATTRTGESMLYYLSHYLQFVLLEGGILWILLLAVRADGLLIVAGLTLWLLPLAAFGGSNDLAMRGSIPALVVLAFASAAALADPAPTIRARVFWPIVAVLLLGVPTALTEVARAVAQPVWGVNSEQNLIESFGGDRPAHYFTKLQGRLVVAMMRPVRTLPGIEDTTLAPAAK